VSGSVAVLVLIDKLVRRMLPLAALLQLTLVFPDETPSRFRMALKAGSGRRLARVVAQARADCIADDRTTAAEQLVSLATVVGDHDRRTRGHSERVRLYAELLADELHLDARDRARLQWAALLHDVGKIHVPAKILNKKGKPSPAESAILQRHPLEGERLAAPVSDWLGEWAHASAATTNASTALATRADWPATTSREQQESSPSPTASRS
jgi:HD-GYP domain-containing protein (c-di-GMP phosphodiesterase class II)